MHRLRSLTMSLKIQTNLVDFQTAMDEWPAMKMTGLRHIAV